VRTRRRRRACHASPAASSPGTPQATTQPVCHLTGPADRQYTPARVCAHGLAPTAVDVAATAALPALLALPVLGWCWPINIAGGTGVMITAEAGAPGRALLCGPCRSCWQPKTVRLRAPHTAAVAALLRAPAALPRLCLRQPCGMAGSTHGAMDRPEARRRGRRRLGPRAWIPCSDGNQRYLRPPRRRCDRNHTRPSPAVAARRGSQQQVTAAVAHVRQADPASHAAAALRAGAVSLQLVVLAFVYFRRPASSIVVGALVIDAWLAGGGTAGCLLASCVLDLVSA
jgi:hypothetical protein